MTLDAFAAAQLDIIRTMNFADYLPTSWRVRGDALEVSVFMDDQYSEERMMDWARKQIDKADDVLVAFRVDASQLKTIRFHSGSMEARIIEV